MSSDKINIEDVFTSEEIKEFDIGDKKGLKRRKGLLFVIVLVLLSQILIALFIVNKTSSSSTHPEVEKLTNEFESNMNSMLSQISSPLENTLREKYGIDEARYVFIDNIYSESGGSGHFLNSSKTTVSYFMFYGTYGRIDTKVTRTERLTESSGDEYLKELPTQVSDEHRLAEDYMLVVNISGTNGMRFLKIALSFAYDKRNHNMIIMNNQNNITKIRTHTVEYLSSLNLDQVKDRNAQQNISRDLLIKLNQEISSEFTNVYITEFIVQ